MSDNIWADTPEEKELDTKERKKTEYFKPKAGQNRVRLLGRYKFFKEHFISKVQRSVTCPGNSCPYCQKNPERQKLMDKAKALSEKLGKDDKRVKEAWTQAFSFDPKPTYVINVLDRSTETVAVWKFSRTLKKKIETLVSEYGGDTSKYDIYISRDGTGKKTRYDISKPRSDEPLESEEFDLYDLEWFATPTKPDVIAAYMAGNKFVKNNDLTDSESEEPESGLGEDLNIDASDFDDEIPF